MAILLVPIFAALGAAIGAGIAGMWFGFDLLLGTNTIGPDQARGLLLIGAVAMNAIGWGWFVVEELGYSKR